MLGGAKQYGIEKYQDLEAFGVLAEFARESQNENLKKLFKKLKQPGVEASKEAARYHYKKVAQIDRRICLHLKTPIIVF